LCLHENIQSAGFETVLVLKGAHKRIVWDCCWNSDNDLLLTASRDGTCKLWKIGKGEEINLQISSVLTITPFDSVSVTSVDMISADLEESETKILLCSVGSENGDVAVLALNASDTAAVSFSEVARATSLQAHTGSVQRIRWRPRREKNEASEDQPGPCYTFVSGGDDFSIRLFSLSSTNH